MNCRDPKEIAQVEELRDDRIGAFAPILSALISVIVLSVRVALKKPAAGWIFLGINACAQRSIPIETRSWILVNAPRREEGPEKRRWSQDSEDSLKTLILASIKSRQALELPVGL